MTETNEVLFDRLRALSIKDRMTRDWFLAFTPTVLALNRLRRAASYRDMHDELMYGRAWNADGPNLFTATRR